MAKRKPKKNASAKKTPKKASKPKSPLQLAVAEAGMITGQILAHIKKAQITFLSIGELLVEVRDRKLYEALNDSDLEAYAAKRLRFSRATLYRYIKVYEWVKQYHPEWLANPVVGRIPDLTEISDLMWIDEELEKKDLEPKKRATLSELRKKALDGDLEQRELAPLRRRSRGAQGKFQRAIKYLQLARRDLSRSANPPADAIAQIGAVIESLQNQLTLVAAGFDWDCDKAADSATLFFT